MVSLYVTADAIGTPTGGGAVTFHESEALKEMGPCSVLSTASQRSPHWDVWDDDLLASQWSGYPWPKIAHFYAGTFGKTVAMLKGGGCKVVYTIAAHDREVSRREHERLGLPFPYPHLTEEPLWQRYIEGYRLADVIVCPSSVAARTVRAYGPDFERKRVEVIPHGVVLPGLGDVAPLPGRFTVGYLGSYGADKGVIYLLHAWKKLNYPDADLLLGGKDSGVVANMAMGRMGLKNVRATGWLKNVSDFYNRISLYVQPSATEGFGIEVLEAMAHGRAVICSDGAGAVDVIPELTGFCVGSRDAEQLAEKIDWAKKYDQHVLHGPHARSRSEEYSWGRIRERYKVLWQEVLG